MIAKDGYIIAVTKDDGNYEDVLDVIRNRPIATDGYGYRLREDLTWELYELPAEPAASDGDEISAEEAYNIIMGVIE